MNIANEDKLFWAYMKKEKYSLFYEIEKMANKSLPDHNLIKQFKEVRQIYEHEQMKVLNHCESILNNMAIQLESIENRVDSKSKALQISKKYAFDYTCNYNRQHEFSSASEASHKIYQQIIIKLYQTFGSLLEGIITNIYSTQAQIKMPKVQPGFIIKGFIVKQLLTVFKIKDYVIEKLKQNNFRQNITLSEFFNNAPYKILLGFTTINVHKARLEFMNKNTLPNMPVWAAIISSSCIPYFYRDYECPREWQYAANDTASLYNIIVDDFFKSNFKNYKNAKYITGNLISSLPLQLLTNGTILSTKFKFQQEAQPYLHIGFAFDSKGEDYTNKSHLVKRNNLNIGIIEAIKMFMSSRMLKFNEVCNQHKDDPNYALSKGFSVLDLVRDLLDIAKYTHILKYMPILTESNDNYMLHTYWDRLIKLPIKFDTLDFHEITNSFLKKTYGADVSSDKAKDTVERSYEITKYFERKQFPSEENKRYDFIIRTTIIQNKEKKGQFAKLQLLSHSKWNRNRFNNFLVYYSNDPVKFDETAKIAMDSEILWNISHSSKVYLRFYFPIYADEKKIYNEKKQQQLKENKQKEKRKQNYQCKREQKQKQNPKSSSFINQKRQMDKSQASTLQINSGRLNIGNNDTQKEKSIQKQQIIQLSQNENLPIYSSILFTQLEVSLINIINELPLKNSYDYKLNFDQPLPQNEKVRDPFTKIMISQKTGKIPPFKKNAIPITIDIAKNPTLNVNTWSNEGRRGENSYTQPLL